MLRKYTFIFLLMVAALVARAQKGGGYGLPFFRNFSASEYGAHNRNFDVECGDRGYVFFANFEGLLYYDGVDWDIVHTKDIARITSLRKDSKGRVWFGGYNALGYATTQHDSLEVHWIKNGIADTRAGVEDFGCIRKITEKKEGILFVNEEDDAYLLSNDTIVPKGNIVTGNSLALLSGFLPSASSASDPVTGLTMEATSADGLRITRREGDLMCYLNTENGLCSNSVTDISFDGYGTVWGTTDNGIFAVSTSNIYSRYTESMGLQGQVMSILEVEGNLCVGTLQGLFYLNNNRMSRVPLVKHATWQLAKLPQGGIIAATADGVYMYPNNGTMQTNRHALSVYVENEESYLIGELEGIHRHYFSGKDELIDEIPNASKMISDGNGGVWAITLDRETWHMASGEEHFRKEKNDRVSLLFEYKDDRNYVWHNLRDAKGLFCEKATEEFTKWLSPFDDYSIQTMYIHDGIAWVGGNFGVIRMDINATYSLELPELKAYIRDFHRDRRDLSFAAATNTCGFIGKMSYSYRTGDKSEWSSWKTEQNFNFANISSGLYRVQVRAMDAYGRIAYSDTITFEVLPPFLQRWYTNVAYFVLLILFGWLIYRWRMIRMRKEKEKLERIVDDRTQQLREAHAQLVRKEKEATVGALTKGLIDRILNPMNYINNFSHLSLGLVKDMKANVEDINDAASEEDNKEELEELYEDSMDVLDMLNQNLTKIEEHGISTTRTLKAMEEMLKYHLGKVEPADIANLVQQDVDLMNKYYEQDIRTYGIKIIWQKPADPIVADVDDTQLGKAITCLLGNSVYALKKKAMKKIPDYVPEIKLSIEPASGEVPPVIVIRDNGIGIEDSIKDKIFDPFFTTKPTAEASGVGLYLCKQIVEDLGGTITVESEKDEWTEFKISLP